MYLSFLTMIEGMNQTDVERLKQNFGHYLFGWRLFSFTDFMKYVIVVLDHHFNIHTYCGDWCKYRDVPNTEEEKRERKARFRDKEQYGSMYEVVADILNNMCTYPRMKMCYHIFSCQRNEMLNRKVSANCPKDKHFSSTTSLKNRIDLLIMRDSLGEYEAVKMVLDLFAMSIPVATKNYLISQDTENAQKSVYHKQIDVIKRRSGIKLKKMRTQFIQEKNINL